MEREQAGEGGVTRRTALRRGGMATLALGLAQLPFYLDAKGLLDTALAQSADMTTDTFNGLVAFVVPGNDAYSRHQGDSTDKPGGIAAGTTPRLIGDLNKYVPAGPLAAYGATLPSSGGVATALNSYAQQVNPGAAGPFPSHFARLSRREKGQVFQRWEGDPQWEDSEVRFVAGILPGFATFLAFSEAGVIGPNRRLSQRPVGWQLTGYDGVAEGRPELKGYYRGRRRARR